MSAVQWPRLAVIEKGREDDYIVHFELCRQANIVLVMSSVAESSQCQACFADVSCNLFVQRAVMGYGSSRVFEALKVCELWVPSMNMDCPGWLVCGAGW